MQSTICVAKLLCQPKFVVSQLCGNELSCYKGVELVTIHCLTMCPLYANRANPHNSPDDIVLNCKPGKVSSNDKHVLYTRNWASKNSKAKESKPEIELQLGYRLYWFDSKYSSAEEQVAFSRSRNLYSIGLPRGRLKRRWCGVQWRHYWRIKHRCSQASVNKCCK